MNSRQSPSLSDIWSQVPADYFWYGTRHHRLQRLWHQGKLGAVQRVLTAEKGRTVIDVGAADGSFLHRLVRRSDRKMQVIAIDPYFPPLQLGRRIFPSIQFLQGDIHQLPVASRSADVVLVLETLEHLKDPYCALREVKRVLRENGSIIVEMDSGSILFRAVWFWWKKFGRGRVWNSAHLTSFNVSLLEQLFCNVGLEVKEKVMFNLWMGVCFRLVPSVRNRR